MSRKTKKRLVATLLSLAIIFYALPYSLSWYGSRLCFHGTTYKEGREYASSDFSRGIRFIRCASYFPGFGSHCEMLIRVYLTPPTVSYYLEEYFVREHVVTDHYTVYLDSLHLAERRNDTIAVSKYRALSDEWMEKDPRTVALPVRLQDSICRKWADITALLSELNEKDYPPLEFCR
jgi:hypothetical protein